MNYVVFLLLIILFFRIETLEVVGLDYFIPFSRPFCAKNRFGYCISRKNKSKIKPLAVIMFICNTRI